MELKSLLLCSDEKIVRVLRRTLGDLEIGVELCGQSDGALRRLTRERFEAIIVDCAGDGAADVLRSARLAPCNKRAIAVAILDRDAGLKSAFDLGAHFTLHKPVTAERAKSSFRAARALMKKERRRNARVQVSIPVEMSTAEAHLRVNTIDLGEGGLAVHLPHRRKLRGRWELKFTLPGSAAVLKTEAEFAWEGSGTQVGLRFENQSAETTRHLRAWLDTTSLQPESDDPPVRCRLTDLSLGGCYLESNSPFPVWTRLTVRMKAGDAGLQTEGVVRVMHPERGMGVEFTQKTADQNRVVESFLAVLSRNSGISPEILVEPEGLETESDNAGPVAEHEDPLIGLFRKQATLAPEAFLDELRKQRGAAAAVTA